MKQVKFRIASSYCAVNESRVALVEVLAKILLFSLFCTLILFQSSWKCIDVPVCWNYCFLWEIFNYLLVSKMEGIPSKARTLQMNLLMGKLYRNSRHTRAAVACFKECLRSEFTQSEKIFPYPLAFYWFLLLCSLLLVVYSFFP